MQRKTALAAVAGMSVLLLAIAAPAEAKVLVAATITGPGLSGPIEIGPDHMDELWDSGFMEPRKHRSLVELGLSASELGPRFQIVYRFDLDFDMEFESTDPVVRQDVYPYAEHGRPVTYMPEQIVRTEGRTRFASGWWAAPSSFRDFLVGRGLPETAPVVTAQTARETDAPPKAGSPWLWIAVGLSGLVGAAAVGAALRRRAPAA